MNPSRDIADVVSEELLLLRRKMQGLLYEGDQSLPDAHDAYVSALLGHLFASLLTRFENGQVTIDRSPEGLAEALALLGKKLTTVAESLDPESEYRIQISRREKAT